MKIAHKIHIANLLAIVLIALIGYFSYLTLNEVLTKLRFIEIADDLNASFLEMRLNEKNYFLYHDTASLTNLSSKIVSNIESMDSFKSAMIKATGERNYDLLKSSCENYLEELRRIDSSQPASQGIQAKVRDAGQKLREFSKRITAIERQKTNNIIMNSKRGLLTTLCLILVSAAVVSYLFFYNILKSLKWIKAIAKDISDGRFQAMTESDLPNDEVGSVLKAINYMAKELAQREEQILQSKKLASIGILTAGVAHELGNPLNNIAMVAQTYQEFYHNLSDEDRQGFMKTIEEEAERIKDIITELLDFSKPKKQNIKTSDINTIISKSLKLVRNLIHISNINVELSLEETLVKIPVDENRILEVLVNMITNAVHAMKAGGALMLATWAESDFVAIRIKDTGKGIPSVILPHLFDPFFSTKGGQGTGLGLFVSYGIIADHGGTIKVESDVGAGTTFTVFLPVKQL